MHIRHLRAWLVRLTSILSRKASDRELEEELESHLQMHIEDNVRAGLSPEEARRLATQTYSLLRCQCEVHSSCLRVRTLNEGTATRRGRARNGVRGGAHATSISIRDARDRAPVRSRNTAKHQSKDRRSTECQHTTSALPPSNHRPRARPATAMSTPNATATTANMPFAR